MVHFVVIFVSSVRIFCFRFLFFTWIYNCSNLISWKDHPFCIELLLQNYQKSVGYICVGLFSVSLFHFLLKDDKWYCILFSVSPCSSKEIQPMSGSWCWITQPCWTQPAVLTRLSRFPGVLDTDYHGTWHRYAFAFSFPLSTCLPLLALLYWLDLLALSWTATVAVYIFVFTFKSLINCDVAAGVL